MEKITAIRGFKDILPDDALAFCRIESLARTIFDSFGFREIRVPILEKTELFKRSIGETTDIVEKEMYTFTDRDNDQITLRPEATASVIRAYIEHNMSANESVTKLFTFGPMFRRERPQKGRFRQFNQIDVEVFGDDKPQTDAEVIFMLMHFLNSAGLRNLQLEINSLGCSACRPEFSKAVIDFLKDRQSRLCPDCQRRIHTNPLRVFDCKIEACREIITKAPSITDFLCEECKDHFAQVLSSLAIFDIAYTVNPRMVRGLDYYTRTAFEITTEFLGAQNAVAGGGRYDGLIRDLGGPDIPGIGFAVGFERLLALTAEAPDNNPTRPPDLFIAALGEPAEQLAYRLCNNLRLQGRQVEMDYQSRGLKSQMKRADKLKCRRVLIIGDREIEAQHAEMRDMTTGGQVRISLGDLSSWENMLV